MRRILLIIMLPIILFTFTSCGESTVSKAQNYSNEFLEKLYTFQNIDKIIDEQAYQDMLMEFVESFKPYMTDKGYKSHVAAQDIFLTYYAAWANSCNISTDNIKTSLKKEYKEDKYYVYDYSLDIIAAPLSGGKEIKHSFIGEITIKQDKDKFLVEDYRIFDDQGWAKFIGSLQI